MGSSSDTVRYKSFKETPLWLKFIVVGVPAMAVIMLSVQIFITLEDKGFDAQLERKIERIHGQITEGRYREIFLEGDRGLVASYDESEFSAKLAKGRNQLSGKYKKMTGSSLHYPDVYYRVKRLFGRPALAQNHYTFKSDTHAGREMFYWILRGDEIRLVDYEFYELNRRDYNN